MDNTKKSKLKKRLKIILCLSASLLVILLTVSYIVILSYFKDKNRSSYQTRDIEYSEIIKKNYIEAFKDTSSTGSFSYYLPKEDINELLAIGAKSLNNKQISNIYIDYLESGQTCFCVDLTKVGVTTRVVISTTPSIKDDKTIRLTISNVTIGKVNGYGLLKNKGYLTSSFIDSYFKACHLPVTYNEETYSFEVKPYSFISMFPHSDIIDEVFRLAKDVPHAYSFNSHIFGFDLDLTKLGSKDEYIASPKDSAPNIPSELKEACITNYASMIDGETKVIYTLSESDLNKTLVDVFESNQKEEISSSLTSNKAVFDLIGVNIHIDEYNKINLSFFYSLNGYVLSFRSSLRYMSCTAMFYSAYFAKEESDISFVNKSMDDILSKLTATYSYYRYPSEGLFMLDLQSVNQEIEEPLIRIAPKSISINHSEHLIEFNLTKE